MKSNLVFILTMNAILLVACQSAGSNQGSLKDSTVADSNQPDSKSIVLEREMDNEEVEEKLFDELIIKGKDIWVRDIPATGKVVMKLNEGDKCKILEKGKLAVIKGRPDYWYQIEFNQKQGWVFGSQTSMMLFKPIDKPFAGNLTVCDDPLIAEIKTPASYSYSFTADKSFHFAVAAGYIIEGKYEWKNNNIMLDRLRLIMDTPDGSTKTELKGNITFCVFGNDQLICLCETVNKLADKNYVPAAGCFCLGK